MKKLAILSILLLSLAATPAHAYKEIVHRMMSLKAFDHMTADLMPRLGIDKNHAVTGIQNIPQSPRALVGQGAYDEDDDANSLWHFYDPRHNAGLSVPPLACHPFTSARDYEHNTVVSAARAYYQEALIAPNAGFRDEYLEKLFLQLGHVIHLVQDMAQPEHTRNDQHLTGYGDLQPSMYEEWGLANLLGPDAAPLYEGYPNVSLAKGDSYFATAPTETYGQGLAQFSNNWFVTQDTNYVDESKEGRCYYYNNPWMPDIGDATPRVQTVSWPILGNGQMYPIDEKIYTSHPVDGYTGVHETDPNHDLLSSIDYEAGIYVGTDVYSLSDQSYLSRAALLVPRAVGYSAGYLDHFFRGRITAAWQQNPGGGWDVKITNLSGEPIGQSASITVVYLRDTPNYVTWEDRVVILDGAISTYVPGFAGLPSGASVTLSNVPVPNLQPSEKVTDFERHIVVRGPLGTEDDDVIGLVQHSALRAVVSWDNNVNWDIIVFSVPFVCETTAIAPCAASQRDLVTGQGFTYNNFPTGIATITVPTPSPTGGQQVEFTINMEYLTGLLGTGYPGVSFLVQPTPYCTAAVLTDFTLQLYIDKKLIQTFAKTVDASCGTSVSHPGYLGSYPPEFDASSWSMRRDAK
jgi:hypothetical protein